MGKDSLLIEGFELIPDINCEHSRALSQRLPQNLILGPNFQYFLQLHTQGLS